MNSAPPPAQEINNLKGKLNALSGVLRLGHEAFQKNSMNALCAHIVNNSRMLSNYDRSSIADMRAYRPSIEAISGQSIVNRNSEFCLRLRHLLSFFKQLKEPMKLSIASIEEKKLQPGVLEAFKLLTEDQGNTEIFLIPLKTPVLGGAGQESVFIWVLEFFNGIPQTDENIMLLLSQHYAEAVWSKADPHKHWVGNFLESHSISPLKATALVFVILILLLFGIRIRQYAVADFEIVPYPSHISYSPMNGLIGKVFFENGKFVKKNDKILEFDKNEISYNLAAAIKSYEQTSTELDVTRQKSFSSPEFLGKTKILTFKKEQETINIEKNKWMLSNADMRAGTSGILVINSREKLEGRLIKPGEKLFEIISPNSLVAEIWLNEKDASVLCKDMIVALYLHTAPEKEIRGMILSVTPKPILTEDRKFCYMIRIVPDVPGGYLLCGMRGVARVGGERVSLGYYLFRSIVLWWRRI